MLNLKNLLIIATILNVVWSTYAFSNMPIRMMLKNDAMSKGKRHTIVDEMLKNSKICAKKSVSVDTIILNIYKINKFHLNTNSPTISLSLKDYMKNMFYINEQGEPERLLNTTTIISHGVKNFFVYELDVDMDVDCIMYNSF